MSRTVTLAAVLVAGVAATLVLVSIQRGSMRDGAILDGIVDPDPGIRARAWSSKGPAVDRRMVLERLHRHRDRPEVLAEAAIEFDRLGWPADPTLVVAAARLGDPEPLIACLRALDRTEETEHLEARRELMRGVAATLGDPGLRNSRRRTGDRIMEACLKGLPPGDHPLLMEAMIDERTSSPDGDRALLALALLGSTPSDDFATSPAITLAGSIASGELPADPDARALLPAWVLAGPRLASDGESELRERARRDDSDAGRVLAVLDRDRFLGSAGAVLADRTTTFDRRAIAATRLLEHGRPPGDASIINLLLSGPGDADGNVHAAACIAWRGLSDSAREGLLDRWWRSEDPAEVRAALLLVALRHHEGLLAVDDPARLEIERLARDPEAPPEVRRTARLTARATGDWPFDADELDAEVYADRTRRLEDGRIDPDAVLLGLITGDPVAERLLVSQPLSPPPDAAAFAREIASRRALAGLFHPEWIDSIGEPVPGDEKALRLWTDLLAAARLAAGFAQPASSGEDLPR